MQAHFYKYTLQFKNPSRTSRGILTQKETYFLVVKDQYGVGVGECNLFRELSADDVPDYEQKLQWACQNIDLGKDLLLAELIRYPSIVFGLEQAFLGLETGNPFVWYPSDFTAGKKSIPINGLIWMGKPDFMRQQIIQKIEQGFTTIKLKIAALDFETELSILRDIRKNFSSKEITLRVDANGGFSVSDALEKLKKLSDFDLHSIEQPIKAGQWHEMAELCRTSPVSVALDEELIGVFDGEQKQKLMQIIQPQYIILKPALHGGFSGSDEWIELAGKYHIGWWVTSALESNVGLNAIAQYTYKLGVDIPQGLGTGGLFTNNFESPLYVEKGHLNYNPEKKIKFENLKMS